MMRNRWVVLAALFLARCSLGYHFQSVASVAPLLVEDMGIGYGKVGALIGFFSTLGILTALPSGLLGRRWGESKVVLLGLGAMAVGGILMGLTDSYALAAAGRLISGAGAVALTVTMVKLIGDLFEGKMVVTALAILINSWPVGITIGLWTQGAIAEAYGWQAVFLSAGGAALLGMILVVAFYRPPPRERRPRADAGAGRGLSALFSGLITRREALQVALAGMVWSLFNGGFLMIMSYAPAMLSARGFDVAKAGALVSTGTVAYMIAIPLGGWLSERIGRPNLTMVCFFVLAAATVAAVPFVDDPVPLFALAGVFIGIPTGNVMALTVECVRAEHRNAGNGIYYTIHYIGLSLSPAFAGWLADVTGDPGTPMLFGAASTTAAILVLAALRLVQRSR